MAGAHAVKAASAQNGNHKRSSAKLAVRAGTSPRHKVVRAQAVAHVSAHNSSKKSVQHHAAAKQHPAARHHAAAVHHTVAVHHHAAPAAQSVDLSPQQIAHGMMAHYGWSSDQYHYLFKLWMRESTWNPSAVNPSSGAYGIPQALPASQLASAGPDWKTNPATQIKWGLGYIQQRYGNPAAAWAHEESHGWY